MPVSCSCPSGPEEHTTGGGVRTLELEVTKGDGETYQVAARCDAGDAQEEGIEFPFRERELDRRLDAVESVLLRSAATTRRVPAAEERPLQELGAGLFDFLFSGGVGRLLAVVRSQAASDGELMQIRLRIRPPRLAALPWELLYDRSRAEYLSLHMPLVRHLEVPEPVQPLPVTTPLRVLAMVASPAELESLDVHQERQRLHDALAQPISEGLVQVTWVAGQTWRDLRAALAQAQPGWHIFHFIGHGGFDEERGEGFLALVNEGGGIHRLSASDLGLLFRNQRSLRLVVLNACESARSSTGDAFSSTASMLMRRGVTAVVAMQYEISDDSAIEFARGLYEAIANRAPADVAVSEARVHIKVGRRNSLEWMIPVLYLRSPHGELLDPGGPPDRAGITLLQSDEGPPGQHPAEIARENPPSVAKPLLGTTRRLGVRLWRMKHGDRVVAFSPDGTLLATGSTDRTARVWSIATGEPVTRMDHDGGVLAVAFSPDGDRLATGSYDGAARIFSVPAGEPMARMDHDGMMAMALSPDGTRLVTGGQADVQLWDAETGALVARMPHDDGVLAVAFSPDGTRLATGSRDGTAKVWASDNGRQVARLDHGGGVLAVALSANGTRLGTGSYDKMARVWDVRTQVPEVRVRHDSVLAVTLSPDGRRLATGSGDQTALLWDVQTDRELARMKHEDRIVAVTFSPAGDLLATSSSDNTAWLWAV
jgi:hypothetical protein